MATFELVRLAPADRLVEDRQELLNGRMRLLAFSTLVMFAAVIAGTAYFHQAQGLAVASLWLALSSSAMICALRWADRRFIAPLQACCQADFNRHVEALFGSLLEPHPARR